MICKPFCDAVITGNDRLVSETNFILEGGKDNLIEKEMSHQFPISIAF